MARLVSQRHHVFQVPAEGTLIEHAREPDQSCREPLSVGAKGTGRHVKTAIGRIEQQRELSSVRRAQRPGGFEHEARGIGDGESRQRNVWLQQPLVPYVNRIEVKNRSAVGTHGLLDPLVHARSRAERVKHPLHLHPVQVPLRVRLRDEVGVPAETRGGGEGGCGSGEDGCVHLAPLLETRFVPQVGLPANPRIRVGH